MDDFTLFAETPCDTLEKLRLKGVPKNSNYTRSLEAACKQKMQVKESLISKNNFVKIAGISAVTIGLITFLIILNKKK